MIKGDAMNRKVSVIIPAYNVEKYIGQCLESVCNQSYGNIQIIVVDDGSTDRTLDIINEYSQRDSRIDIIIKDNGGVSSARNLALKHVSGEYIAFLDGDDTYEREAIEVLVKTIECRNAEWVSFQHARWDEGGKKLSDFEFETGEFLFHSDEERFQFIIEKLLSYRIGIEVWNKLFKKDIISKHNIIFSEKCHIGEDYAFTLKYLMHAQKIVCIPDKLYRYRVRKNSAMSNSNSLDKSLKERAYMLLDIREYFQAIGHEFLLDKFPLLFILLFDKVCGGYCASEVAECLKRIELLDFIKVNYKDLPKFKSECFQYFSPDISRIKYIYHMYIRSTLLGFSFWDKLKYTSYNIYRKLKGTDRFELWIIPY